MPIVVLTIEDDETSGDLSITLKSDPPFPTDDSEKVSIAQFVGLSAMAHLQTLLEKHGKITGSYLG